MAKLDRQYYILVNTVSGYIEPGTQYTSGIPKLYTMAGAKRSITFKKKWAAKAALQKGESIVLDNWEIVPVEVKVLELENVE